MLVAFAACLASDFDSVALLAVLCQGLAVTSTTNTVAVYRAFGIIARHGIVVNGTVHVHLGIGEGTVQRQAGRWRGETGRNGHLGGLGHCVSSSGGVGNGDRGGRVAVGNGGGKGGNVGSLVGDGLASGDAVVRVEGSGEERMGRVSGVHVACRK